MTVSVQTPITSSIANGVTSVFPYQFKILADTDLKVTVNGLARTLGTHYTVDGVGNDTGGDITFLAGFLPANGAKVVRRRLMAFERVTNYQTLGDLLASTLNNDQDAPVMMIQQLAALALQMVDDGTGSFAWDAQGYRLIRLGDAVDLTDAANLGVVLATIEQVTQGTGPIGGTLSVIPKYWEFTGDGVSTDFPLDGADVDNPLFYDTALAGLLQEPYDGYTIVGNLVDGFVVRYPTAPAVDVPGWVILRGYARPYSGVQPILTVASTVVSVETLAGVIDSARENTLIGITSATDVTLTVRVNTGAANDWKAGEFFSVMQLGAGKVTLAIEAGGTLLPSPGFQCVTRGQNSVISASCVYADSDQWAVSGDLLAVASTPDVQCFTLVCSDEATTNLAVATNVYRFRMPYGFLLSDVRVTVNVAQASGTVLTADVKKGGVSIFSTLPTIDNTEFSSTTAAIPPVISTPVLGDGDLVSVDVTQVGTAGARGLKIQLIGQRA